MKQLKLTISIIVFAVIVLLGGNVFADMDAPSVSPYKAYVSNPNGAIAIEAVYEDVNGNNGIKYIQKAVIPYGTEFTVIYEYYPENLNELYVTVEYTNNQSFMIPLKDITLIKDKFTEFTEENGVRKEDATVNCKILNPNGVQMYTGPAYAYQNMNITIPFGTELTYDYIAGDTWVYVTYQGQEGWICVLNGNVGNYREEKKLTGRLCKIYDFNGNVIGTIPGNIKLENVYFTDDWTRKAYIKYNGITGFVDSWYDVGKHYTYEETDILSLYDNKKIYEYADVNSKVLGIIPKGTEFKEYYYVGHNMGYYYLNYNGVSGWVTEDDDEYYRDDNVEENNDTTITNTVTNEAIVLPYDGPDMNNNNIFINNHTSVGEENKSVNNITDTTQTTPQNLANQIIILAIGAAIIGAVSSLVTILLINKTGKNNKNENQ